MWDIDAPTCATADGTAPTVSLRLQAATSLQGGGQGTPDRALSCKIGGPGHGLDAGPCSAHTLHPAALKTQNHRRRNLLTVNC